MRAGPSQEEIRRHNLSTLLRHVHLGGPASRAVLADRMGLNRSTILGLVNDLTTAGLVAEETPRDTGRAGRPSLVVRPAADHVYALAFDVGVDHLTAARVGLGGAFLARRSTAWPGAGEREPGGAADRLAAFARELAAGAAPGSRCVGVGAAVRGLVRHPDGLVRRAPNIGWTEQDFRAELADRLGPDTSVAVDNEANLGALAEHLRGAGAGFDDLVYLHGDAGIGGGIIAGGRLLRGADGYGGEVGHLIVNPRGGRRCGCGSSGCLEAEAGERALLDAAGRGPETTGPAAVRAVVDAADRGDIAARAALHQVGDWLGVGVSNLVNLLNPRVVIFGGILRDVYLSSAAQIRSRINTSTHAVLRESLRLRVSGLGTDSVLVGAAELGFAALLADPLESPAG
ncbi:ROK family protein [Kitasatospora sp. NPDC006697]|uniref:ROK family protein n=1 Tax=Kitasatospora sp. NPDC006697 TaxID=3364020 RepID=UPI0036AEFE33